MRRVFLFAEDSFHEDFLQALVQRFSREYGVAVEMRPYSARGGIARVYAELKDFLRDLRKARGSFPDAILVANDANCRGYAERRNGLEGVVAGYPELSEMVVYAIPDPHVEMWMLVDPQGFKTVFGKGFDLPQYKCERHRYKRLLIEAIRAAGIDAPLGGREYCEDVVTAMDLPFAEQQDPSLGKLLRDLKSLFNRWTSE